MAWLSLGTFRIFECGGKGENVDGIIYDSQADSCDPGAFFSVIDDEARTSRRTTREAGRRVGKRTRIDLYTGDESHVINGSREKLYCSLLEPF